MKEPVSEETKNIRRQKRKKAVKTFFRVLIILTVIAVAAFFVYKKFFTNKIVTNEVTYTYATATRRSIVEELTGSGTLQTAASYTLSTRVSGEILSDTFDEGDTVKTDDVLYKIDNSDMDASLERARKSLSDAQKNYDEKVEEKNELSVIAPIGGVISGLNFEAGDSANSGATAFTIKNISTLTITEYYSTEYMDDIKVGMNATVSVSAEMLNLVGRVAEVSSLTRASETGVMCFAVKIAVENPGSLGIGTSATTWVGDGIYPTITSTDGLLASETKIVRLGTSGDVKAVNATNGDIVKAGMTVIELDGEQLEESIEKARESVEDAQLSLDNIYDSMENYTVRAPIDGTVVRKAKKAGESASNGDTLCMIYDLSYLTVTLAVDELDISKVSVGQTANVTADAVTGKTFEGIVTRVGVNGTTSGGVTTYPVDIRIDDTDGLLPGMNADIVITVREAANVVTIPVDALERNNRVLVKKANKSAVEQTTAEVTVAETAAEVTVAERPAMGEMPTGERPAMGEMPTGERPTGEMPSFSGGSFSGGTASGMPSFNGGLVSGTISVTKGSIPEGYEYVTVEIGMSDEDYVEIISGIEEGDTVAYISRTISTQSGGMQMGMMGGFGGNMGGMSGARPSGNMGGMSGSRPSGNMGGNRQSGFSGGGF